MNFHVALHHFRRNAEKPYSTRFQVFDIHEHLGPKKTAFINDRIQISGALAELCVLRPLEKRGQLLAASFQIIALGAQHLHSCAHGRFGAMRGIDVPAERQKYDAADCRNGRRANEESPVGDQRFRCKIEPDSHEFSVARLLTSLQTLLPNVRAPCAGPCWVNKSAYATLLISLQHPADK